MGLAASQARYLELTARKTDVEFQGQQINQQRTELADMSAGMFAQLMALEVPSAPSSSNYTTTNYTFNDGQNKCTISSIKKSTDDPTLYNSTVTYYYPQTNYTGMAKTRTDFGVRNRGTAAAPTYWLTNGVDDKTILEQCGTGSEVQNDKTAIEQIIADTGSSTLFALAYNGGTGIGNIYKYKANGVTNYYCNTDLNNAIAAKPDGSATPLTGYYASDITTNKYVTENAYLQTAPSGRYSTIKLQSQSNTLDLTALTTTDQNAYQDALNDYEYKQMQYQQEVNSINAKTSQIQAQDRTLELQLKQLDTEQEALSTELESVKKVIDKNIEQTFKTFQ